MPIFPFSPFYPNYYSRHYPHYYINNGDIQNGSNNNLNDKNQNQEEIKESKDQNGEEKEDRYSNKKRTSRNNSFANINLSALLESDLNTPVVEILGIKLYLDDLIIIGLLFFLYKEDVQDEILFGILLMLLLS